MIPRYFLPVLFQDTVVGTSICFIQWTVFTSNLTFWFTPTVPVGKRPTMQNGTDGFPQLLCHKVRSHKCFGISNHWRLCCLFNAFLKLTKNRNFTALFCWLFARAIHPGLLESPHKRPVMCEQFSCDNIIMVCDKCPLHQGAFRAHKRQPGNCFKQVFVAQYDN